MWIFYALFSACCLGFYDVFKKASLRNNAVIQILLINTLICSAFFMPFIISSGAGLIDEKAWLYIPGGSFSEHLYVIGKAFLVLSSWVCGYFSIKHLPLTIAGPVNATRPVMVITGALLFFGERLNAWQWAGVATALMALFMLSGSGKKEGIDFRKNKWVFLLFAAAVLGALSGLYDKLLIALPENGGLGLNRYFVQGWYNLYQAVIMSVFFLFIKKSPQARRKMDFKFRWSWSIPLISVFLTAADLAYLYALSLPGAMIAIVSMIRRGSVLVSFTFGALIFHEKNLKGKALDLALVLLSTLLLFIGTLSG